MALLLGSTVGSSDGSLEIDVYGEGCLSCLLDYVGELNHSFTGRDLRLNVEYLEGNPSAQRELRALFDRFNVSEEHRGKVAVAVNGCALFINYVPVDVITERVESGDLPAGLVVFYDELSGVVIVESGGESAEQGEAYPVGGYLPLVVVSGLLDGINPCAFTVLIYFVTLIYSSALTRGEGNAERWTLWVGALYILGVYIGYLVIG
ncbi:hypothetical protein JXL21_14390, partial [Candidatus Bathyarchaeota archaeon]|nr:hypothetical protein [Candidatus Bathyarchaeota archaeon]